MIARLLIPLLLLCALAFDATAQDLQFQHLLSNPLVRGRQGKIIVKVTPEQLSRGITRELFGTVGHRYGVYNVEPWLNPTLVMFGLPAFKSGTASTYETRTLALRRIMVVEYSSLDDPEDVAAAIGRFPGVEYAEPMYPRQLLYTPNDPDIDKQWYLDSIHAKEAWDVVRGDASIIVAVTDSGVEGTHADLKDAMWRNPGETGTDEQSRDKSTNGVDDDDNGYVDDWWGYDFAGSTGSNPDNNPSPGTSNHGTIVSGIIAGTGDNDRGIAGVAYGVKLMELKILDDDSGFAREMEALLYAAKMKADVINCSWGGRASYRAEQEVIDAVINDYDVVVVAAAGNDGIEGDIYPASYDGVISVAAITQQNGAAGFSNYGHRVDLCAPGIPIFSTVFTSAGSYDFDPFGGTSFSAPMVSGAAALVRRKYPDLNARQVREVLRSTTDDMSQYFDVAHTDKMGTGRLNISRAVLTGPTQISARVVSHTAIDADGNNAPDPGENVRLRIDVQNVLANAAGVTVNVSSVSNPGLPIQGQLVNLGSMVTGEIKETPAGTITFTVPPGTPENTEMMFKVDVIADGRSNAHYIRIRVAPTFLTTDLNNITATFNSTGNIGYNGLRSTSTYRGDGFVYNGADRIYHGGLIIATGPTRMADVVRRGVFTEGIEDGFRTTSPYRLATAQDLSVQTGTARFNDAHLPQERRVGVDVTMTTYEFKAEPDLVIVAYKIRNTSGERLTGMRAGLYLDWDVGDSGFEDQIGYDADNRFAYARGAHEPERGFVGTTLLSPQDISFYAVDNDHDGPTDFFTSDLKWNMLSSGIHENSTIGDMGMVIGGGPITLEPDQETDVVFALMGAQDFPHLRELTIRAQNLVKPGGVDAPAVAGALRSFAAPNPFGDNAALSFTMPRSGHAVLTVHDIAGRMVATVFDGDLNAGAQRIPFTTEGLAEGIYVYEIRAAGMVEHGKMVKGR